MKRYIKRSSNSQILFEDHIIIDLDIIYASKQDIESSTDLFPGMEKFKQDVINLLESYQFEVIEDVYNGKKQKGYFSNRKDSISLYIDTYFDFANLPEFALKMIDDVDFNHERVHCFIHIRFSDHWLNDEGDTLHRAFLKDNALKYGLMNPKVTRIIREEEFILEEGKLYRSYHEALTDLKGDIEDRFIIWARKFNRIEKLNRQ